MKYRKAILSTLCLLSLCGCATTTLPAKDEKPVDNSNSTETEVVTPAETQKYLDDDKMECGIRDSGYTISLPKTTSLMGLEDAVGFHVTDKKGRQMDLLVNIIDIDNENPTTELLSEIQNFMSVGKQLVGASSEIKYDMSLKNIQSIKMEDYEGLYNSGRYEMNDKSVNFVNYVLEIKNDREQKQILEILLEGSDLTEADFKVISREIITTLKGGNS